MSDGREEIRLEELSATELKELAGQLGQSLTVEQLGVLMQLVNSCEDLDQALEALDHLDHIEKAA